MDKRFALSHRPDRDRWQVRIRKDLSESGSVERLHFRTKAEAVGFIRNQEARIHVNSARRGLDAPVDS
jgi:hypothetical protein